jgi:uncharacterized protein (DUF427 family)
MKGSKMKAIWNGEIIAESENTIVVEGNHYFPPESVNKEYLKSNTSKTFCPWKGTAQYYSIVVDGRENRDAAWYYAEPSKPAAKIKDHIAFWHGVEVNEGN